MAGLEGLGSEATGGSFGGLAWRQYGALIAMRWRATVNSVRSVQGAFELGARGVAFFVYAVMGLGLGFGLGAGAFTIVAGGKLPMLSALLWVVFLVWQALPIVLASFQERFDVSGLLRFPVSFGTFYLLNLVTGFIDVPAILGGICSIGIWAGVTLARPALSGWTALLLVVFAAFNVLLARTVLAWVDRWLAKRRTREIVSAIFLVLMLSLQLLNPALQRNPLRFQQANRSTAQRNHDKVVEEVTPWAQRANAAQLWLPPGLTSRALSRVAAKQMPKALESIGVLWLYFLATFGVLAIRLRAEYRGELLSDSPGTTKRTANDSKWLLDGQGPIFAVVEKELRTVPRSMPLLFAIGAPLLTVLVISTLFRNGAIGGRPFQLAFPLCVCYALLGFTQMIFNNLGAEGTGIQMLFMSPTPIRKVLLAKNLFHGALFLSVAFLAGVLATLRLGHPNWTLLAATAAWVLFALPMNLAAGNLLSLTMPYRVNLGRISRQRGSQASALVSMLIQAIVMGCGVAVLSICTFFNERWLAAPCLLVMAGVALVVWMRVLASADSIANRNRDNLIATLAKTE